MPYITFSKKFADQRGAKRIIERNKVAKDSAVELRGSKTINKIIARAKAKGFKNVLIINKKKGKMQATEITITMKEGATGWKYGKTRNL